MAVEQLRNIGITRPEQALLRLANSVPLRLFLALNVAAAGSYSAVKNFPAIQESINSFLNSFTDARLVPRAETNPVNPDGVFDNTSMEKRKIPPQNTIRITEENIDSVLKEDKEGNPVYLFPLAIGTEETIEYDKEYPNRARVRNVKKGTPIIAGRDGYAFAWATSVKGPDGKMIPATGGRTTGIDVVFIGSDGYAHIFDVSTGGNVGNPDRKLNARENIPYAGKENNSGRDFTKGLFVKAGTVVGYTDDIALLEIQEVAKPAEGNHISPVFLSKQNNLNFAVQGEPGATKLYILNPQNQ